MMESLAIHHPIMDGNKRIAFAATDVFLRINGWQLRRAPMQIHQEMLQMLEARTFNLGHIDPWLRGFSMQS
jgi:death-on-curing protein